MKPKKSRSLSPNLEPKRRMQPTTLGDLKKYLASQSDFSLEVQTLHLLRSHGLECEHGGLYEDPIAKKDREFDILAVRRTEHFCVKLAIECKNIYPDNPLPVMCASRHLDERFQAVAVAREIDHGEHAYGAFEARAHVIRLWGKDSFYGLGDPVGKRLVQVRRESNGKIKAWDSEVFEKWTQSLASADDLVSKSYWEGSDDSPSISLVAVIPILVVPDNQLWMVQYDALGRKKSDPIRTKQSSLFVKNADSMGVNDPTYHLSHIEILTLAGLHSFVTRMLRDVRAMRMIFPSDAIASAISDLLSPGPISG